jgi:branched-chain amino acid transport system permease protein
MRSVHGQHGEHRVLLGLLLTLGVAFVIDGLLVWRYPLGALNLPIGGDAIPILGVRMRVGSLWASGIALAVGGALLVFLRSTTSGRAIRSVIQDETGARLVGISPARVRTVVFALSSGMAGLVAVTRSMTSPVGVTDGFDFTILALIVAVVGGLGSVAGALLAGILLGVVSTVSAFLVGQYITTIVLLAAAALTIVIRPQGLLGRQA